MIAKTGYNKGRADKVSIGQKAEKYRRYIKSHVFDR